MGLHGHSQAPSPEEQAKGLGVASSVFENATVRFQDFRAFEFLKIQLNSYVKINSHVFPMFFLGSVDFGEQHGRCHSFPGPRYPRTQWWMAWSGGSGLLLGVLSWSRFSVLEGNNLLVICRRFTVFFLDSWAFGKAVWPNVLLRGLELLTNITCMPSPSTGSTSLLGSSEFDPQVKTHCKMM